MKINISNEQAKALFIAIETMNDVCGEDEEYNNELEVLEKLKEEILKK